MTRYEGIVLELQNTRMGIRWRAAYTYPDGRVTAAFGYTRREAMDNLGQALGDDEEYDL